MRNINIEDISCKKVDDFEFVVSRGSIHNSNDEVRKLELMRKFAETGKTNELLALAKSYNVAGNYSGIFHGNSFKTSSPLYLIGCGFLGPFELEVGNYDVFVEVIRDNGKLKHERLISLKTIITGAKKREIFWIAFENPVFVMPKTWHKILFQLDGPPTAKCNPKTIITETQRFFNGEKIRFDFQLDSRQMPQLKFKMNC